MGLFGKIIEKLQAKNQYKLEDFDKNYEKNYRLARKQFKAMSKFVDGILWREEIYNYIADPYWECE